MHTRHDYDAELARAHKALGDLIATRARPDRGYTVTRHGLAWAAFYDALRFIDGLEDAADEAMTNTLSEMGLDSDGFQLDDAGDTFVDAEGWGRREYTPMTPIYMPQVAA